MNTKFTIKGLSVQLPALEADIKLDEITVELSDLNLTEYFRCLKELPALIQEIQGFIGNMSSNDQDQFNQSILDAVTSIGHRMDRVERKVDRIGNKVVAEPNVEQALKSELGLIAIDTDKLRALSFATGFDKNSFTPLTKDIFTYEHPNLGTLTFVVLPNDSAIDYSKALNGAFGYSVITGSIQTQAWAKMYNKLVKDQIQDAKEEEEDDECFIKSE